MTTPQVTLILNSTNIQGKQFRWGRVRIRPSSRIPVIPDHMLLEKVDATASFSRQGVPQIEMYPNDLIGPQQENGSPGWSYTIYYEECPGSPQPWTFYLLSTNGVGPDNAQYLSDLAEAPVAQPGLQYFPAPSGTPSEGDTIVMSGTGLGSSYGAAEGGSGGITSLSVATAHGFRGSSDGDSSAPTLTIETSVTGLLKGDGTSISPASAGTDFLAPGGSGAALTGISADQVSAAHAPSGTPSAQSLVSAVGSGTSTEWLNLPYYLLLPSGDTSGSTDDSAINAALGTYAHVKLSPGQWHIGAPGLTHDDRWVQGSGKGTVINVVSGGQGFTVAGATMNDVSDMQFVLGSGALGLDIAGASDFHAWNLEMTGSTANGGIKINGDDALEQHFNNIILRDVGGKAFDYERTTSGYTGSLYLSNVRIVAPPSGAFGFYFNSTAGSPSLNTVFMNECVADAFLEDALYINNCCQCFIEGDNWFAVGSGAAAGSAPIHIAGGSYGVNILGGYLYNGLASGGFCVKVTGSSHDINIGGGITFDGNSATTLLGLAGAGAGVYLGDYQIAFVDGIYGPVTDTPALLTETAMKMLGDTNGVGEETQDRRWINDHVVQTSGLLTLSYFKAKKTEFIGHIEFQTQDCSTATGATYAGVGLFTVSPAGLLTLVAKGEVTSSITLMGSSFQYIGGFDTKVSLSSSYLKRKGQIYAVGALWLGSGAGPQIKSTRVSDGAGGLAVSGTPLDQLSAQLASQTTLGTIGTTTHAQSALASCGYQPYFVLEA